MKVRIFIERTNENKELDISSISEIFDNIEVSRNSVIITRDDELITEDEKLKDNDEIKLLSVISGG